MGLLSLTKRALTPRRIRRHKMAVYLLKLIFLSPQMAKSTAYYAT